MANQSFYRRFSWESFNRFLFTESIDKTRLKLEANRRHRCFGLEGFIWMGLLVAAHTSLPNLQQIFNLAGSLPYSLHSLPLASVSAFCQYRANFPLKTMLYLWQYLLESFRTRFKSDYRWRGFNLRALDGTLINLPEQLYPHFGALGGWGPGPVQGFLMVLYDLAWGVPITLRIRPAVDEGRPHLILKHLLGHLRKGELLLIDAGLYSMEIFCLLLAQNTHFIIPMRSNAKPKLIKRFSNQDGLYQIKASRYWKNNPLVSDEIMVRIITYQIAGFRPRRLVTSLLDAEQYPAEEIIAVYHRRWEIETFFREFKHTLQVTRWHAETLPAFYSELLFQMLLVVLTRLAMAEAAVKEGVVPNQLSFGRSLFQVKRAIGLTVFLPVSEWIKVYVGLINEIQGYRIDIRPGRRYERDTRKRRLKSRARYLQEIKLKENENVA